MNATDPVDDQNDLGRLRINIGDHLMDNGANNTLLQTRVSGGGGPDGLEVRSERSERYRSGDGRAVGSVVSGDLVFDLRDACKRLVPARLQFASHEAIGGVGGVVLPEGAIGCIARCFEIALECFAYLIPPLVGLFLGGDGRRNSARADYGEKRILDSVIDPQTAERDATRFAIVHPASAAAVARDVVLRARVAKGQFASAATAA